jgi:hypothetical protein
VLYGGIASPTAIAVGDLNSDGKPDVVVAGLSPTSNVPVLGVYLNNGSGTFGTPTLFPFNGTPAGVAIGSYRATSGSLEPAVFAVDASDDVIDAFLGDGQGNFTPGVGAATTSSDTVIAAGDFNGDGVADLAVIDPANQAVDCYIGRGDGSFNLPQILAVPTPKNVIVGDFNGDAHLDLAILSGNGSIYVALNQGSGTFAAPVGYPLGSALTSATDEGLADFNGDHLNDLVGVGTSAMAGQIGVLLNQGAGVFGPATDTASTITPVAVAVGDYDGDGHPDIGLLSADGTMTILPGNGGGTFGSAVTPFTGQLGSVGSPGGVGSQAIAVDLNGDGFPDLAYLTTTGFGATLNTSTGSNTTTPTLTPTLTHSTLPTAAVGGKAVHGSATIIVTNSTAATIKGPATVTLYASADGSVDANSVSLGLVKRTLNLKPNAVSPFVLPATLPASLEAGTYTLLAQTVDPSGNATTATAGASLVVAAPFITLSETFQRLVLPMAVVSGTKTPVVASIKIANSGNMTSSGTTTISLYASGDGSVADGTLITFVSRRLVIGVGKSVVTAVPLRKYPSVPNGDYFVVAAVTDPDGGASSVSSATTVNIAAAFIDLAALSVSAPVKGTIGKRLSVTVDVTNDGNSLASGPLQIAFAVSQNTDGSDSFALGTLGTRISLMRGVSRKMVFSVPLVPGTPGGNTYIVATVDPADMFVDSNLMNNTAVSTTFTALV